MKYYYQIDYGDGYQNVYPIFDAIAMASCDDDIEAWFKEIELVGAAKRARVLFGSQVIEERIFKKEYED